MDNSLMVVICQLLIGYRFDAYFFRFAVIALLPNRLLLSFCRKLCHEKDNLSNML